MKVQLIRDDIEVAPHCQDVYGDDVAEWRPVFRNHTQTVARFFKKNAVIEERRSYRMVQMGWALPADDECREECRVRGMTAERIKAAQHAWERLHRNIPPEHFAEYDAGYISGWHWPEGGPDEGEPIPGPKWDEYQKLLAKQAQDEDDDE